MILRCLRNSTVCKVSVLHTIGVWSPRSHMMPWALPGENPVCRAKSNLWVLSDVAQEQTNIQKWMTFQGLISSWNSIYPSTYAQDALCTTDLAVTTRSNSNVYFKCKTLNHCKILFCILLQVLSFSEISVLDQTSTTLLYLLKSDNLFFTLCSWPLNCP